MHDSDNYDPATASNSYTKLTIMNAKDNEICKETQSTIAKVYTQDYKLKHEDRFLFSMTTMSNLTQIKAENETDVFTSQLIIPPGQTFLTGFKRLLENTLCQISEYVDVIVFGGTVIKNNMGEEVEPYNHKIHKEKEEKDASDLAFMNANIVHKIKPSHIRFSHFGVEQNFEKLLELKDYALLKNDVTTSCKILTDINNIHDESRYEYDSRFLCHAMFDMISKTKVNRIELIVRYKMVDLDDFKSFREATENYGYIVIAEPNRMCVTKIKN